MKKRLFTFLLALVLIFSALPGFASAAELRDEAAPAESCGGAVFTEAYSRLTRLSGLKGTETFTISEETRAAVTARIITGLNNWAESIDVRSFGLSITDCYDCFYGVLHSHYEYYYVDYCDFDGSGGSVTAICPVYVEGYTQSNTNAFNSICDAVIAGMPNGTDPEKLLYLHDWLVTHCEYDLTFSKTDAYNAIVEGSAVCDGYAKAYKYLCDLAGLECEYVSSITNNHAWNMVKLDVGGLGPAYYYIDCTWDDPTYGDSLMAEMNCTHTFFLQCKEECMVKHVGNDWLNGYGENIYNNPTTEYFRYGNGWWRDLDRPVQWVGTRMCYAKPTENGKVYFRDSGSAAETAVSITGGGSPWYVLGGGGSYWMDAYITVASQGGVFFYTTPTQIYKLAADGTATLVYTLTSAQQAKGYLYGIQSGSAGLTYYIGEDPNHHSVANGILTFPPAVDSVTADKTAAAIGEPITWTALASGGTGTLKYCFYIYQDGTKVASNSYGTANTYTYTPTVAGTYTAKAFVKDGAGKTASKTSAGVTVAAGGTALTIDSITANKTAANVGETITWTASASGGSGTLKYCFYIYQGSTVVEKGSYTTGKTYSYTPTAAGTYKARVYVKDGSNPAISKVSGAVTVTAPLAVTSITADKTSANVGEAITWTASAGGGSGTLKYCFYIYQGSTVVEKGSYTTGKTYTYTPTAAGTYKAKVFVKDTASHTTSKVSGNTTVAAAAPLAIASITADKTTANVDEKITWTAEASGGIGTLKYCFYYYKNGVYDGSSGFITRNYAAYRPTAAGSYKCKVVVKDADGNTVNKTSAAIKAVVPITVTSLSANALCVSAGSEITWNATAMGGTGTVKFCFYVYRDNVYVWNSGYSTAQSARYTPATAGNYKCKVVVKDTAGTTADKTGAAVTAVEPGTLAVSNLSVDSTWVLVSMPVTWYADSIGGTGTVKYCFYLYKDNVYVMNSGYTASSTFSYTPPDFGGYKVKVVVKDSEGNTASRMCADVTYVGGA